jgi:peptidyl-prolyl cis-trans isomerase SurA
MKLRKLLVTIPSLGLALVASGEVLERVVAKVNGEIITLSDFESRQVAAVQSAHVAADGVEVYLRANNAKILQDAIDDLLIAQRGYDLGVRVKPEYVQEVIDGIKKENAIENDQALKDQLHREGMSLDDLKRSIERSVMRRQAMNRDLESKIVVTEAQARADYDARRADFDKPPAVHLQEILFTGTAEETAEAVRQIREKIKAGEDFAALAKVWSRAPSQPSGGDLGWLKRGEMNADIEKAAFVLQPGGLSEPIPVAGGVRIIRLVEKTDGGLVAFDKVRDEIKKHLTQVQMEKEFDTYVEGLRKNALIDIRVREVPLQVSATAPAPPKLPDAPADSELAVTGSSGPERVVPPPGPGTTPDPGATPPPKP